MLNKSTHLLKVDLKSNADIEITRIEWLLVCHCHYVVVVELIVSLSLSFPLGYVQGDVISNAEKLACGDLDEPGKAFVTLQ